MPDSIRFAVAGGAFSVAMTSIGERAISLSRLRAWFMALSAVLAVASVFMQPGRSASLPQG